MQFVLLLKLVLGWFIPARGDDFQGSTHTMPFKEDTIDYNKARASGPIECLQQREQITVRSLMFQLHRPGIDPLRETKTDLPAYWKAEDDG